ncbi:MAG: pentapeptide repeat-containing protein [Chromatiales bacterium]|nr:pentapeptide repeat-containing protein [Chromatiales bacterium]
MPIQRRTHQLCYVRRGDVLRGPFPSQQIRRDWLLGRIIDEDEIGCNDRGWQKVRTYISAHPDPDISRLAYVDEEELERLRRGVDERRGIDRRDLQGDVPAEIMERRSGRERRRDEPEELVQARLRRYNTFQRSRRSNRVPALIAAVLVTTALLAAGWAVWSHREEALPPAERSCIAPPAPKVNWSTCNLAGLEAPDALLQGANLRSAKLIGAKLRGADLSGADLSYADLSGADLSYSDLSDADLTGAQLANVNLSYSSANAAVLDYADLRGANLNFVSFTATSMNRTIWTDGRICANGSRGACDRPAN